ncbi:MAG: hypothetical protein ACI83P_002354, partial [Janthinobacterium sp.]
MMKAALKTKVLLCAALLFAALLTQSAMAADAPLRLGVGLFQPDK